jgi:peptidoglycan/LPS O-acetylase OafA/YrhL
MEGPHNRIEQIDALRGLAALGVAAVFHVHAVLGLKETSPLDGIQPFTWLHTYGFTLVDLFFVISGFIFAHVYLTDDSELRRGTTLKSFAVARFARLYPLHLVTLMVMAALGAAAYGLGSAPNPNNTPANFVLNLLFLQESGLNHGKSFNSPAWSLSVEAFCYVLFICSARAGLVKWAAPVFIAIGLAMATAWSDSIVNVGRGFTGFFVGYYLWRARSIPVSGLAPVLLVLVLVLAIMLPNSKTVIHQGATFSLILWPSIVMLALRANWLNSFRWLGDRSYSIYLVHMPVYRAGNLITAGEPVPTEWQLPVMAFSIAVILIVADVSFRHLERPARHAIRIWADARGRTAALPAVN